MAGNDYSQIAMILAIISAVSFIIAAVVILSYLGTIGALAGGYAGFVTTALIIAAMMSIVSGAIVLIGGILIKNPAKRQIGSILALIFGIIGLFFGGGGIYFTGTILAVVAGILGLVSKA